MAWCFRLIIGYTTIKWYADLGLVLFRLVREVKAAGRYGNQKENCRFQVDFGLLYLGNLTGSDSANFILGFRSARGLCVCVCYYSHGEPCEGSS